MANENIGKVAGRSPAVSVIVPVYNVEPWLARCLDSLLGQTIKDIEIICIDDKSTDGSLKILLEYEKKDSRIKAIVQEKNSGVAFARNTGLAAAVGEYVGFVDSDDFVDSDFYEKLYVCAKSTNANIVKGEALEITYDGKKIHRRPNLADIKKNKMHFVTLFWSAIYERDFLEKNKLGFPVGIIIGEDDVFLVKTVALANKIELVEGTYYNYFRRTDSAYSEVLSVEKLRSSMKCENMVLDFINEKITDDKEAYNITFTGRFKWLLYYRYYNSNTFDGCLLVIREAIELYKKCKYKDDLDKNLCKHHAGFLSEGNEVALFVDLLKHKSRVVYFKLFDLIPLLKIVYRPDNVKMILFRWIPLLRIERRHEGDYYYLFFHIPFIKMETEK